MPRQQFNLAARLEKQATNVENDGHLNAARYMRDAAAALRAAATPSAQGAEVSVDELADFMFDNGFMVMGDDEEEGLARALLGKYRMEKR